MFENFNLKKILESGKSIQMVIVLGMLFMMMAALIIDGDFGERVFAMLIGGFGLILGYFFRKAIK